MSAATMAGVVLASSFDGADRPSGGLSLGQTAPPLEVEVKDGTIVEAVDAAASGHALIVFFNTGCVYCRESLPTYREVALQECSLRIAFVVLDRRGEDLRDWWSTNAWDPEEGCGEVLVGSPGKGIDEYGVRMTPTHVLVEDAVVVEQHVGALSAVPGWLQRTP